MQNEEPERPHVTREQIDERVPSFRPELVPGPFDIAGLDASLCWLAAEAHGEFAGECVSTLGALLYRARELGIALQELWTRLEAVDFDVLPHEEVMRMYAGILEEWTNKYREDREVSDAIMMTDVAIRFIQGVYAQRQGEAAR